jgi:hypothetical protein
MIEASYGGTPSPDEVAQFETARKAQAIIAAGAKDPETAILNAQRLPSRQSADTLASIADEVWEKDPAAAQSALDKLLNLLASLDADNQAALLSRAAYLYLQMGDNKKAGKMIALGLDQADKLYDEDSDPHDPNQEPKANWPSTHAYRYLVARSAKISLKDALATIKKIPDDEIQLDLGISLADSLLGAPLPQPMPMVRHKKQFRSAKMNYGPM